MAVFYLSPAGIDDFGSLPTAAAFKQKWHDYIANGDADFPGMAGRAAGGGLFYDAQSENSPDGPAVPVPWNGFPRSILQWFNADTDPNGVARALAAADVLRPLARLKRADTGEQVLVQYRQQDEYCEWHADRNPAGAITRISFTAEGPEYWEKLAETDRPLLLALYRRHIDANLPEADLYWPADMLDENGKVVFGRNTYNRWNKWNTLQGAMHLTHPANTLGAEINLAADATRLYPSVTDSPAQTLPARLICCAGYGGVNRSSDPLIGAGVNGFARAGKSVTLANPVGLYISEVGIDALRGPGGNPVGPQCLTVVRASADQKLKLRVEVAPPAGAGFTLDQCTFDSTALTTGGQIALRIGMVLFAHARTIAGRQAQTRTCRKKCCSKPEAPNFRAAIDPGKNCASLTPQDWADEGPLETALVAADGEEPALPANGTRLLKIFSRVLKDPDAE